MLGRLHTTAIVNRTSRFLWTSAARSHVGRVREINEDAYLDQPDRGLWAVADGMGGHAIGDYASRKVMDTLSGIALPTSLEHYLADAKQRLQEANRHLREEAGNRKLHAIGSTIAMLLAWEGCCGVLWAGDSRIYLCRGGRLRLLTRDHSQIEDLIAKGLLARDDVANHPPKNFITRAVGALDALELDADTLQIEDEDIFLLCSDGLTNEVSEEEIRGALVPGKCRQASEALVDMALERGGRDNISVIVVHAEDLYSSDKTMLNPAL